MRRLEARAKAEAEAERQRAGKTRRGKTPKAVDETPDDKAQMSFTDPELHIMQANNKGGAIVGMPQSVSMARARSLWRVTSPLRPTTSSKPCPWRRDAAYLASRY